MPRRAGLQRGYLRIENGSWIGYYNDRVFDPTIGKSRWMKRSVKICPARKINATSMRTVKVPEVEARLLFEETVLSRLVRRSTNPPALATVRELWDKVRPNLVLKARKMREHWRGMMENHILPALGKKQLRDVRQDDVQALVIEKIGQGYSPQTVWHIRTKITTLFKKGKAMGWYSGDLPTEGVEMPKMTYEERQPPTAEHLTMLVEALGSPAREVVAFLAMTGLNKSEMQGLRRRRVNLSDEESLCDGKPLAPRSIAVREQFVRVYGKALGDDVDRGQYQGVKARERNRDVPLSSAAVELLRKVMAESKWTGPNDPVFAAQKNGQPINADNILRKKVKPALLKLGLSTDLDLHTLRHFQTTAADQAGLTEGERQRILGQASRKMTARYTHAEIEHARAAFEAIGEKFRTALTRKPEAGKVVEIQKRRKAG
jgi:integrase